MTLFRPTVRFTGPDGRCWELYAYKTRTESSTPRRRRLARLAQACGATVHALRSDAWTIEAISWLPHRTAYTWRTTSEFRGQVLAQVEGSLARGDVPAHLTNAAFGGESSYVRRSARYRKPSG